MVADPTIFSDALNHRNSIVFQQQREINGLYVELAQTIQEEVRYYELLQNVSESAARRQANDLIDTVNAASDEVMQDVERTILKNMRSISNTVINNNVTMLSIAGLSVPLLRQQMAQISDRVIQNIVSGAVYRTEESIPRITSTRAIGKARARPSASAEAKEAANASAKESAKSTVRWAKRTHRPSWSLSSSIWGSNQQTHQKIREIVLGGMAQQKSVYQISKDLERWVNPDKRNPWNLINANGRRIYPTKVDYNAQRLARTMAQHAYQQTFFEAIKDNPNINGYYWMANGSRPCPICLANHGKWFQEEILDHPNGQCTMVPNLADDWKQRLTEMLM